MAGHVTIKRNDKALKALQAKMRVAKNSWVTVGVHEDAGTYQAAPGQEPVPVSKVAFWLEQGTQHMPARPFFYPALAANQERLKAMYAAGMQRLTQTKESVEQGLGRIGFAAQVWVQNVIKSNVAPALSPAYLKRRRVLYPNQGSRTLIASGLLLRSVRYKLVLDGHEPVVGPASEGLDGPAEAPAQPDSPASHSSPAQREAARNSAGAYKATQREQRRAAKANPEAARQAFNSQRRAYGPTRPKGSP